MLVTASIDDMYGKFIFDTAADGLLLNHSQTNVHNAAYHTATGTLQSSTVKVGHLCLGNYTIKNLKAHAADLSNLEKHVGSDILGIIGAKLLDSELLLIDQKAHSIEFINRSDYKDLLTDRALRAPIRFENDVPILSLNIASKNYNFILDTGASISLVDQNLIDAHKGLFEDTKESFELLTAHGSQNLSYYYSDAIQFKDIVLQDQKLAAMDFSHIQDAFELPIAGILSLDELPFHYLILDYRNGWLYVNQL